MKPKEASSKQIVGDVAAILPIPLTFSGAAAFSRKPASWLLLIWISLAHLASGAVLWFFHLRWIPVLEESAKSFPKDLSIRTGRLHSLPPNFVLCKQNRFFSLTMRSDPEPSGDMTADFQLILTRKKILLKSWLSSFSLTYPDRQSISLAPDQITPWWNARKALFTAVAFAFLALGLLALWACLATCCCLPIAIVSFFAGRRIGLWNSWRLAGSATIPGASIMIALIFLYGLHLLRLPGLLLAAGLCFFVVGVYILGAVTRLPQSRKSAARQNPFASPDPPARNFPPNASS